MIKYLLSVDKKYIRILFIGWTCIILFLLLSNGSSEKSFLSQIPHIDKLVHFCIFFAWATLYRLVIGTSEVFFILILTLVAFGTEYLQQFVINRTMDFFDGIIDLIGGIFGYYLIKYLKKSQ